MGESDLSHVWGDATATQRVEMCGELARELRKFHSATAESAGLALRGYGVLADVSDTVLTCKNTAASSWKEYFLSELERESVAAVLHGGLSREYADVLTKLAGDCFPDDDTTHVCLVHGDVSLSNVRVDKDGHLAAIMFCSPHAVLFFRLIDVPQRFCRCDDCRPFS